MKYREVVKSIYHAFLKFFFKPMFETRGTNCPITFAVFFYQKILGFNRRAYWPVHFTSIISCVENIFVGIGSAPGLAPGCYIQGIGKIHIGNYTFVAPNVGIISANHNIYDLRIHKRTSVKIGSYCWIGMNAVVLPGVELGDFTVVGAGSVVTHSFRSGYCIIAGNPAKLIRNIDPDKCIRYQNKYEYHGYYSKKKFDKKFMHIKEV